MPPTAVGRSFSFFIQIPSRLISERHQRQLVVRSDPFYKNAPASSPNATNGSWWFVQILSTKTRPLRLRMPPTAVGGSFRSFLQKRARFVSECHQRQLVVRSDPFYKNAPASSPNATNGSWWFVQILSTNCRAPGLRLSHGNVRRKDLNYPPTAGVGGISVVP